MTKTRLGDIRTHQYVFPVTQVNVEGAALGTCSLLYRLRDSRLL